MEILTTAAAMREMDRTTIQEVGIPGAVLMENAGRSTAQLIFDHFAEALERPVTVLAGKGNNGGDGFVIARYLLNREVDAAVVLLTTKDQLKGDAELNMRIFERMGGEIRECPDEGSLERQRSRIVHSGLLVDALLGTGLDSEVRGLYRTAIEMMNKARAPVAAVDIPSGLHSDTGQPLGVSTRADLTATYGLAKVGQIVHPGRVYCGDLHVVDICIPASVIEEKAGPCRLVEAEDIPEVLLSRHPESHKGDYGHLLVVAGSARKSGAAVLACRAAHRAGAGLVTLAQPAGALSVAAARPPETMTEPLAENREGGLAREGLEYLSNLLDGKTAVALGPGIPTDEETDEVLAAFLSQVKVPLVIDADGLNLLSRRPAILKALKAPAILTPHPGEMSRLTGVPTPEIQADRVAAAGRYARENGVILLLKGAITVTAAPEGPIFLNPTGNAGMASGGMGDVLTGLIGGLACQKGIGPLEGAVAGAYLHGLAGDLVAEGAFPTGLTASDVIDALPEALRLVAGDRGLEEEETHCHRHE